MKTLYSYQRSTVFAHPMKAEQIDRAIESSQALDVWPICVPGKRKAERMRAYRHPFMGLFYYPIALQVSA
jgi:hypothetical protein